MYAPGIVARTMSVPTIEDEYGNTWQYHSRSDSHSKVACWGILFDLLQHSAVFARKAHEGSVVFGINHRMVDFKNNRRKNLDLVVCTPGTHEAKKRPAHTLKGLAAEYGVQLSAVEKEILEKLPDLHEGPVGSVQLALEAKACMTAHVRALPRFYDELNSSHLTVHGSTDIAIAAGFAMVNISPTFVSPDRNKWNLASKPAKVSVHKQPSDAQRAVSKVMEIPRRTEAGTNGFDALALVLVDCRNDGQTPVTLVTTPPAPPVGDVLHYEQMILRAAQLYDYRFGRT